MEKCEYLLMMSGMCLGMGFINYKFDNHIVGIAEIVVGIVAFIFYLREDAKKG